MSAVQSYILYRNVLVSIILLGLVSYTLFTVDLEISTVDNKEFIRCGLNICQRFEKFIHYKFSVSLVLFLILFAMAPMILYIAGQDSISIHLVLFTPIIWIAVLIRSDIISMDHYLMGIDTKVFHGPARNIIMGITFVISAYSLIEIAGLYFIEKMKTEKKIESEVQIKNH